MNVDHHESFLRMIDESLACGPSTERDRSLREHIEVCTPCAEYLRASREVIEGLEEFSFDVDPALNARVLASLKQPALLIQTARSNGKPWGLISAAALVLTLGGSFIDLQCGSLIASVFAVQRMQLRQQLLVFWIVPSLCIFLLFPLLPFLSQTGTHRHERTL